MLQRKLITVCTALLVFITTHAQLGTGRTCSCAMITTPAHYVKSDQPNAATVATTKTAQENAGSAVAANITVDNSVYDPYHVQLTNVATNDVYDYYLQPFNYVSTSVPDGTYDVSFTPNGGLSGKHYFTACGSTQYNYSAYFTVTISGSGCLLNIWDWP